MENWTDWPDEKVFGQAGEQPGSQASYWRDIEIKRRLYNLQREALVAQLDATASQREAVVAQREAIIAQRDAVAEMRKQSNILVVSVIGVFLTAVVTMVAAFIN